MTASQELQGQTRNMALLIDGDNALLHAYHTTSGWTTSKGLWVTLPPLSIVRDSVSGAQDDMVAQLIILNLYKQPLPSAKKLPGRLTPDLKKNEAV